MFRRFWLSAIIVTVFFGCSSASYRGSRETGPKLSFPTSLGEGSAQDAGAPRPKTVNGPEPKAKPRTGSLPDPEPLRMAEQWEYEFIYDAGEVRVGSVRARTFPHPVVTARKMGRFAVELWIGRELIERVRFDFPLIAAEEPTPAARQPLHSPPTLGARARATQRVLVPASSRAVRAVLVDRAKDSEQTLPWPPDRPLAAATNKADDGAAIENRADAAAVQ